MPSSNLRHKHSFFRLILLFAVIAAAVFCLFRFLLPPQGQLIYDSSLKQSEINFLKKTFTKQPKFRHDLTVSADTLDSAPNAANSLLFDILVPVTDFYTATSNISSQDPNLKLSSIRQLKSSQKMLSLDQHYFFDDFNSGAKFRVLHFSGPDATAALDLVKSQTKPLPNAKNTLSFAQTGVTALSRGMNAKLDSVGNASFFARHIKAFLSSKDLTHTSNEASFSKQATATNICAKPKMIDALTTIGLDIVELTGNHNQDCGDEAAAATIDQYHSLGIKTFGGGKTATAAAKPLQITQKQTRLSLFGYNFSTGGYTTDNTPGANFYNAATAAKEIATAKQRGDFVIVDIQYYECSEYDSTYENPACDAPISGQRDFFRHIADLGADIVVGSSAHQIQTYERYQNSFIYYGLGNLFFDQSWWPGTTRSLILTHYFVNGKHVQTRISPTQYNDSYQPKLIDEKASTWLLNRLNAAR